MREESKISRRREESKGKRREESKGERAGIDQLEQGGEGWDRSESKDEGEKPEKLNSTMIAGAPWRNIRLTSLALF
jgi:hypothetical protein